MLPSVLERGRGTVSGALEEPASLADFAAQGVDIAGEEAAISVQFPAIHHGEAVFQPCGGVYDVGNDMVNWLHVGS